MGGKERQDLGASESAPRKRLQAVGGPGWKEFSERRKAVGEWW